MPDVLVVEDNAVNRKLVGLILTKSGYTFATAEDGAEALDLLAQDTFRLVLMDMMMPGMNGYEATAAIRQQPDLRDLPIIALTANVLRGEEERCRAAGCNDFIGKPYGKERVLAAIKRLIGPAAHQHATGG